MRPTPKGAAMFLRALGAIVALISALVHFSEWKFNGYNELHVVGPAFLVNAIAGIVIAVLLMTWRYWVPLFLLFGFGVATLGAFVISSTVGLFGVHEQWVGLPVWAAAIAEAVAIVLGPVIWIGSRPEN